MVAVMTWHGRLSITAEVVAMLVLACVLAPVVVLFPEQPTATDAMTVTNSSVMVCLMLCWPSVVVN